MELRQLEAFLAVAECGHFGRAAERLFLTQPALSSRVQSLEQELGEQLFVRGRLGAALTDAGHAFLPHARRVFAVLREGQGAIEALRAGEAGRLGIAASSSTCNYVLPPVLRRFLEAHPQVEVTVRTDRTDAIERQVLAREAHLGIAPAGDPHPALVREPLYADPIVCVVAPTSPLARPGRVPISEVAAQPILLFNQPASFRAITEGIFAAASLTPRTRMELDNFETTRRMVIEGLGVAFLPRVSVAQAIARGLVAEITIADVVLPARQFAVLRRRDEPPSGVVLAFLRTLREVLTRSVAAPEP